MTKRRGANASLHRAEKREKISKLKPGRFILGALLLAGGVHLFIGWYPKSGIPEKIAPMVAIGGIRIEGVTAVPKEIIYKAAALDSTMTMVNVSTDSVRQRVAKIPQLGTVKVRRTWDKKLAISIADRVPVALPVLQGKPHFMDSAGAVWPFVAGKYYELPIVTGATSSVDHEGIKRLKSDDFERLSLALKTFAAVRAGGKKVVLYDISSPDMITLQWDGILPEIRIAIKDMRFAVNNIETLLHLLEKKELYATEYIDFSYRNVAFIR